MNGQYEAQYEQYEQYEQYDEQQMYEQQRLEEEQLYAHQQQQLSMQQTRYEQVSIKGIVAKDLYLTIFDMNHPIVCTFFEIFFVV